MRSERLTILVTPEEKAEIAAKAERLGTTSSDFVRLAADAYGDEEMNVLESLAKVFADTMSEARARLEKTNDALEVSLDGRAEAKRLRKNAA